MIRETEEEKIVRRLAWRLYRYYRRNPDLLEIYENDVIFRKARNIVVRYHNNDDDEEATTRAVEILADIMNECEDDDFVPTPEIEELVSDLFYKLFAGKILKKMLEEDLPDLSEFTE